MKILFVTDYYYPHAGGVEEMIKNIAEGLAERGNDVHILTWKIPETNNDEIINNVKVHRYFATSRYAFLLMMFSKIFFLKQFDVIHTTTFSSIPTIFLVKLFGKPCFITLSEIWGRNWFRYNLNPLLASAGYLLEKILLRLPFDKFVVPSESTKRLFHIYSKKKDRVTVIKHGLDYRLFNPNKYSKQKIREKYRIGSNFMFLFYGRFGPTKGLEYLLEAIPLVVEKIPKAKFMLIVTSSPNGFQRIQNIIKNNNCEKYINLIKAVPRKDLPYYIAASDCVVVPSLNEGFGFAAAEACVMNKKIVVSDVSSLPEVVFGKVAFSKPADPKSIAQACENIYKGKFINIPKKSFKWDDSIQKYLDIYEKSMRKQFS